MNRIYQGKVTQVEIPDPANKGSWLLFHRDSDRARELTGRIPELRQQVEAEITARTGWSVEEQQRRPKSLDLLDYEKLRAEQRQQWLDTHCRQRQGRALKPAWGNAPGFKPPTAQGLKARPIPPPMRHSSPHHERGRTDGSRRWRSWVGCSGHMGRCPMLASNGPLALASLAVRHPRQVQNLPRTRDLRLPRLPLGQVNPQER